MRSAKQVNRAYFRQAYRTGRYGWWTDQPSPFAVRVLRQLRHRFPAARLLDLGCGEGRNAIAAARLGFNVTAVDLEPLALKRARAAAKAAGARGIRFRRADALHLPFGRSAFDIVLDYGCLHHQTKADWPAYLASILRVLRPRGLLILSVFSPRFRMFRGARRRWHIAQGSYRRCFTPADLRRLFGRDFRILKQVEDTSADGGFWHVLLARRSRELPRRVRGGPHPVTSSGSAGRSSWKSRVVAASRLAT
jgi:SAM-dependent methyltransferase